MKMREGMAAMINALGFAILGSYVEMKPGDLFNDAVDNYSVEEPIKQTFAVIGPADEEDVQKAATVTGLKFHRNPKMIYYKVTTD